MPNVGKCRFSARHIDRPNFSTASWSRESRSFLRPTTQVLANIDLDNSGTCAILNPVKFALKRRITSGVLLFSTAFAPRTDAQTSHSAASEVKANSEPAVTHSFTITYTLFYLTNPQLKQNTATYSLLQKIGGGCPK